MKNYVIWLLLMIIGPKRLDHVDPSRSSRKPQTIIVEYLLRHDRMMRVICNPAEGKGITKIVFMKPEYGVKFYRPREIKPSDPREGRM